MNQTEHYKLSQWEPSDRIQMEDFNADNAKVETALAGLESRKLELVKLGDYSASFNGSGNERYWYVPVDKEAVKNAAAVFFFFKVPGSSHYIGASRGGSACGRLIGTNCLMGVFPGGHPEANVTFVPLDGVSESTRNACLFKYMDGVSVYPSGSVLTGDFYCSVTALI